MKKIFLSLLTLTLLGSAMAQNADSPSTQGSGAAGSQTATSSMPRNDAEITNSLMTVNTQEMNLARLARQKAENKQVKEFSEMMFSEHAKNNDKAQALATKQGINLKETQASMNLKFTSEDQIEQLRGMKGKQFDKAYMQTQVDLHRKVLDRLDNTLIPNAKDSELKAMLQQTRGKVQDHMNQAEKINSSLQ